MLFTVPERREKASNYAKENKLVYLYIGTKAQAVKMVPVIRECLNRGIPFCLVSTGQHGRKTEQILEEIEPFAAESYVTFRGRGNVDTLGAGLRWLAEATLRYVIASPVGPKRLFVRRGGIALVHGDTASTLLTVLVAKRAGQKIVHVEAGLRSWQWFNPFPEEIIRVATMRLSDYMFAPTVKAFINLKKMGLAKRSHTLPANTSIDALSHEFKKGVELPKDFLKEYALATIHRLETIYSRSKMLALVDILIEANKRVPIVLVGHPPTVKRLIRYGLLKRLNIEGISCIPLVNHATFVQLVYKSQFVITDGGSVQEEAYYLGVPCLLYRDTTERNEGLNENVVLSGRKNRERIKSFIENYQLYKRASKMEVIASPSTVLIQKLIKIYNLELNR